MVIIADVQKGLQEIQLMGHRRKNSWNRCI